VNGSIVVPYGGHRPPYQGSSSSFGGQCPPETQKEEEIMKCPTCKADLRTTDFGGYGFIKLDVCQDCQGAWFDKGELDRLDESVWINVEKAEFHKAEPEHKDIKCPKCQVNLEPLSPMDAKELTVDRCPSCQGFWLDKGELDRMREVGDKIDSEILEGMTVYKRPPHW
jgi:Zn-finger nucleic acid-binding protein